MISATATADVPGLDDVRLAAQRIGDRAHRTPLWESRSVSERAGMEVLLKCENLQRTGSFKIRGATNAILALSPREVVAFSSGNHAQAVALAARSSGIRATIVMPADSMPSKLAATRSYGAEIVSDGVDAANRRSIAERIASERGATLIPPFDHPLIIAGAGTVGLEILEQRPDVRTIIVPLGGGGLLAGTALNATSRVEIIGVEPESGNDGQRSLARGEIVSIDPPSTIADGARTPSIGTRNFEIIRRAVSRIVTTPDDQLLETTRWAISRTKLLIEPTGALGLSALLSGATGKVEPPVAVILSGGNVDLARLA